MASDAQAIEASISAATAAGFRERLLARGQARSMIWRDGLLPDDAPPFSELLSYDLLSYGYALLSLGIRLVDLQGSGEIARSAFERAAEALEAVVAKGEHNPERDFHRVVAAAAYHLGRFSARSYSLLRASLNEANLSPSERCLALLMLRKLSVLDSELGGWRGEGAASDERLIATLAAGDSATGEDDESDESGLKDVVNLALTDEFISSLAIAMLAFERGERTLLDEALAKLQEGLACASDAGLVALWWCHRLAIHLLRGLWDTSLHVRLPLVGPGGVAPGDWTSLRSMFVASLYRRDRAEIELWPSQLRAAQRALDLDANLVLALPTSAGKTRIAELCILACLASGKRVVFVTPLRALSAQTEITLQRSFEPLGKSVSTLYGSVGASGADSDALRERDIIVATPEKLDFALRNDASILDDVGLVVLDEGHMIGLGEREVRYEAQIQRLLRRPDAPTRRIVCLSAILPEGDQLEDFADWLTRDNREGLIKQSWRPTRLRFGEVVWRGGHARLTVSVGGEQPFVPAFVKAQVPPRGGRKEAFPRDQRELCLATAWRLVEDGQTALIFCPQRRSVEPFAKAIVDLNKRGVLPSLRDEVEGEFEAALAIGSEWLGAGHVVLACLKLGVAIHHGALPTPYRKEVEKLLRTGALKVTVSSPTLAQGLNLSATCLIFHALTRVKDVIDASEFRNVVGRAGRAYVDMEGLVLYPMFDNISHKRSQWQSLVDSETGREMESGLLRLIYTLLNRMAQKLGTRNVGDLLEYVAGVGAWEFPQVKGEPTALAVTEAANWHSYMTSLDTAILSLIGEYTGTDDEVEKELDKALTSSLFERRLKRREAHMQEILRRTLAARARFLWSNTTAKQRRGYFFAGVGYETGRALDARASELESFLISANVSLMAGDAERATETILAFAEIIFRIEPFTPSHMPADWETVLRAWLSGESLAQVIADDVEQGLRFVEEGLIYRLPWGMEAVRVRALANDAVDEQGVPLKDYELRLALAAIETGTTNRSAAYLIQSGFTPRSAAIKAVVDCNCKFTTAAELREWLRSDEVANLAADVRWPTPETHELWVEFVRSFDVAMARHWKRVATTVEVEWDGGSAPQIGTALRIVSSNAEDIVTTADYTPLGKLGRKLNSSRAGLLLATSRAGGRIDLEYLGPDRLVLANG